MSGRSRDREIANIEQVDAISVVSDGEIDSRRLYRELYARMRGISSVEIVYAKWCARELVEARFFFSIDLPERAFGAVEESEDDETIAARRRRLMITRRG